MRTLPTAFLLAALLATPAFAQAPEPGASEAKIAQAIALMDGGKAAEAIAILRPIFDAEPKNQGAAYELGMAYAIKGDLKQCEAMMAPIAAEGGPMQLGALTMLGNCLDGLGRADDAIAAYKRGLAIAPASSQLNFNYGVTLTKKGAYDDARRVLQTNARHNPWHVSTHIVLAQILEGQGFRVPAVFAYSRALALEPSSQRSPDLAKRLSALLGLGVEVTRKGANITIDPNSRKEEGDYTAMEFMLAMTTAAQGLEKNRKLTAFEKARDQLVSVMTMFTEIPPTADFTSEVQRPFFAAMEAEKLTPVFAGLVVAHAKPKGTDKWLKENANEIARYMAWVKPQAATSAVKMPQ